MLSNTSSKSRTGGDTDTQDDHSNLLARKIWLPKLIYDALPYFYVTAGFAALFSTLYINHWFWVVPHYLLFSAACVHLGWSVYRKRHAVTVSPSEESVEQT